MNPQTTRFTLEVEVSDELGKRITLSEVQTLELATEMQAALVRYRDNNGFETPHYVGVPVIRPAR